MAYCPNFKEHGGHAWREKHPNGTGNWKRCPGIVTLPERQCIARRLHLQHVWRLNSDRFQCPGTRRPLTGVDDGEGGTVYTVSEILTRLQGKYDMSREVHARDEHGIPTAETHTWTPKPDALQESRVRDGFAQQMDALLVDFKEPLASFVGRLKLESDNARLKRELATVRAELAVTTLAADTAEKAVKRVEALADHYDRPGDRTVAGSIRDAINGQCPPGVHSLFDPCPGNCTEPEGEQR